MKNTPKKQATSAPEEGKPQNGLVTALLTGSFLSNDRIVARLPFVFFLTFLAILYIANGYYSEKTVKQLYKVGNEIKELRSEYISTKSDLELIKQQSHVAYSIQSLNLKESLTPPNKIVLDKNRDN